MRGLTDATMVLFSGVMGNIVQATRDPQDLRFVKFLMESGLAGNGGMR